MIGFLIIAICVQIGAMFLFYRSFKLHSLEYPDWSLRLLAAGFFQLAAMIAFAIYLQN